MNEPSERERFRIEIRKTQAEVEALVIWLLNCGVPATVVDQVRTAARDATL